MPTTILLYNQGQCDQAFEGAIALISDTLVTPNDIVMITPYRGNLECLESIRKVKSKDNPDIANTTINTTDSFQGREGYVVILVLGRLQGSQRPLSYTTTDSHTSTRTADTWSEI